MTITREELGEFAITFVEEVWQWEAFIGWGEEQGYTREEFEEAVRHEHDPHA